MRQTSLAFLGFEEAFFETVCFLPHTTLTDLFTGLAVTFLVEVAAITSLSVSEEFSY
jgi:hypothetical protein